MTDPQTWEMAFNTLKKISGYSLVDLNWIEATKIRGEISKLIFKLAFYLKSVDSDKAWNSLQTALTTFSNIGLTGLSNQEVKDTHKRIADLIYQLITGVTS